MDAKVQGKLQSAARKSKLSSMMGIGLLVALFWGFQHLIDTVPWKYQGAGYWVWLVFIVMFLFGWVSTMLLVPSLTKNKSFVKASEAKPNQLIGNASVADVQQWVKDVAQDAGFAEDDYTFYLVNDNTPNAFAAGTGGSRIVALHTGLVRSMNPNEVKGVLAHEFGHLKNNDIFLLILANSMIMSFVLIGKMAFSVARWAFILDATSNDDRKKDKDSDRKSQWTLGLAALVFGAAAYALGYVFAPIASAFLSRRREDMADAFAIAVGHGKGLASALEKLGQAHKTKPANANMAALYINQAQATSLITGLFGTHPPITKRVGQIAETLSGNEGMVPDKLEGWLKLVVQLAVVAVGAWFLSRHALDIPTIVGVPYAYIASILWAWVIMMLLASGATVVNKDKTPWMTIVIGLIMLALIWVIGYWAITTSAVIPALTVASAYMLYVWVAKPITAFLGNWFGIMGVLSDFATYTSLLYALVTIYVIFQTVVSWLPALPIG